MTVSRLAKIQEMLEGNPRDIFLRYSLAMEQEKQEQHEESLAGLRQLMSEQPPYVPAFFMAAQHLSSRGDIAQAREILRTGIEQARQQENSHAAGEMSEFLASLGELGE